MKSEQPVKIGVVITTYNSPVWLRWVLVGYENQTDQNFVALIADDGSGEETQAVIDEFKARGQLQIEHYWQEDDGFRKTVILNKVIAQTDCDYLIFTDGDCIPRADFIATHRQQAATGTFLSGGYIKLTMPVSESVTEADIASGHIFNKAELVRRGQPATFKLTKLTTNAFLRSALNALTPTKATWNGMNSSGWIKDIRAVNGFDERMQYGGLDRELGERLWNSGVRSKQIRYSAVCLHLDHARGYAKPEIWEKNHRIRAEVKKGRIAWTPYGIQKDGDQHGA
ncbi:glycosyltransferase family 2 protein [Reinekea blandensis]|uniref:Putative glycosyltransferase n=1 Tax=Reinekea blandensis MED297 TaxID=314283 RepID=A4BC97_9GAMM|nr:glycosyltransferase family 2 protein [Reinekea blandensis]EAR10163.1 putative glycosyltransferase [Reinekea sp. MED297] [Reinekea blandensis MED297]